LKIELLILRHERTYKGERRVKAFAAALVIFCMLVPRVSAPFLGIMIKGSLLGSGSDGFSKSSDGQKSARDTNRQYQNAMSSVSSFGIYAGGSKPGTVYEYNDTSGWKSLVPSISRTDPIDIESPHPYQNDYNETWLISRLGNAMYMRIHFVYIETESGYDHIYVRDTFGEALDDFSGNFTDIWSTWAETDVLCIHLTSDSSETFSGFKVDKLELIPLPSPMYVKSITVESPHPYPNDYNQTWVINQQEAVWMRVHFARINTEHGYDYLYVKDRDGIIVNTFTGDYADPHMLWSKWVYGDSISIQLVTDSSETAYGFQTDGVEWTDKPVHLPPLDFAVLSLAFCDGHIYAGTMSNRIKENSVGNVYRYDGWDEEGANWTPVGTNLDKQVSCLVVYKGCLYAGTSGNSARLYKYNSPGNWTIAVDYAGWEGFRSAYVWAKDDRLYLGDFGYDRISRFDGTAFEDLVNLGGSCIWSFESYNGRLYASAYEGGLYASDDGANWELVYGNTDSRNIWALETFQGNLYLGMDYNGEGTKEAELWKYNGASMELVWTKKVDNKCEGALSLMTYDDILFIGFGGESGYHQAEGNGMIFEYNGTTVKESKGNFSRGIQVFAKSAPADSMELKGRTTDGMVNLGTIVFDNVIYTLPSVVEQATGSHTIQTIPPGSYSFHHWEYTDGVSVDDKYANPTQVSVTGYGEVAAVFFLDIRLYFSKDEEYFPTKGLDFDHDGYINFNAWTARNSPEWNRLEDIDNDTGVVAGIPLDAPAYVYSKNEGNQRVIQFWLYYAMDNKGLFPHEHDFESLFLLMDNSHVIRKISLNQHFWSNNYETSLPTYYGMPPKKILIAVERAGHAMILLNPSTFGLVQPDNSPLRIPPFDWVYDAAETSLLYAWRVYDGIHPTDDGFGKADFLRTGTNYGILSPTLARDAGNWFVSLANWIRGQKDPLTVISAIYGSAELTYYFWYMGRSQNERILLESNEPFEMPLYNIAGQKIFMFIEAPWVRDEFKKPLDRFEYPGFSQIAQKFVVHTMAWVESLVFRDLVVSASNGLAKYVAKTLWDPVKGSIVDIEGRTTGYKDDQWVNEVPGVLVLWKDEEVDVMLVLGETDGLSYFARYAGETYTLDFAAIYDDNSTVTFNATKIRLQPSALHKYEIDWDMLREGGNGTTVYVDLNSDGTFEQILQTGSALKPEQVIPEFSSFLVLLMFIMATMLLIMIRKRRIFTRFSRQSSRARYSDIGKDHKDLSQQDKGTTEI